MVLHRQLQNQIRPVRARLHRRVMLRGAVSGLFVGSGMAIALGIVRWLGLDLPWLLAFALPLLVALVGATLAAVKLPSWIEVARSVDRCYELKDRTTTALDFCQRDELSVLEQMQIDDAMGRLQSISAARVAPKLVPKLLPYAVVLTLGGWALLLLPANDQNALADPPSVSPHLVQLAEDLEQDLIKPLKDLKDSQVDDLDAGDQRKVNDLLNELDQMIQEIKLPGVETRDALAKLSDMQQKMGDVQASFDQTLVDAKMNKLGKIMELDESSGDLSQALQKADYDIAAKELDQFKPEQVSPNDKKRMASDMKDLAAEMKDQKLNDLADATDSLGESLDDSSQPQPDPAQKSASSKLANLTRQFAARQAMARKLAAQRARLNESKGVARSGGDNRRRSNQPRRTWGYGKAEDSLNDDPTSVDTQRRREQVTGVAGEGPSERETVKSSDATPESSTNLEYSQRYEQYRQTAESVLQQEELPLGHRETIRRYFESIAVE